MDNEIWCDVTDFEGRYMVSSRGRIKSLKRLINSPQAGGKRELRERILKPWIDKAGYFRVELRNPENAKRSVLLLHRVFAKEFLPNPKELQTINHIDGIKTNNSLKNLEWCTQADNMRHAFKLGLAPLPATGKGELCPSSKLTEDQVSGIKTRIIEGESCESIAADFPVGGSAIREIKAGRSWCHVAPADPGLEEMANIRR